MQIAVIGASDCSLEEYEAAQEIGASIAENDGILICGGLGGVMEAASKGAREKSGVVVGIVPDVSDGNPYLGIIIRTGLGHARNAVVVQSADAVIAVGGSHGTLSEIALALKTGRPVFGLKTWDIGGIVKCATPEEAAVMAIRAARQSLLYRTRQDGQGSL